MTLQDFNRLVGAALGPDANRTVTIPLALARDIRRAISHSADNDAGFLRSLGDAIAAGECPDCRLAFFEENFGDAPAFAVKVKHNVEAYRGLVGVIDQAIERAQVKHREESDIVGRFLADCVRPDKAGTVSRRAMYDAFTAWAEAKGLVPWKPRAFSLAMAAKGFVSIAQAIAGERVYSNARLINAPASATARLDGTIVGHPAQDRRPGFDGDARLGRYLDIANELPSLAPRHNDDPRITRLLREAAKLEAELPSQPISIPVEALRRVYQARRDRQALLQSQYDDVRREVHGRLAVNRNAKLDDCQQRESDIAAEMHAIGGTLTAGPLKAKA